MLWIGHQDRPDKLTQFASNNRIPDYLFDPDESMSRKYGITYGGGVVFVYNGTTVKSRIPKGISSTSLEAELKKIF